MDIIEHFTCTENSKGSVAFDADNQGVSVRGDYQFGNVFGHNILVMDEINIVYNYQIKINKCDTIYLGIIQEDKINEIDGYQPFTNKGCGFALRDDGNLYSPNKQNKDDHDSDPYFNETAINGTFKAGDTVSISLDSMQCKLIFKINNNENKSIMIDNIPKNKNYKLAVYLYGSAESDADQSSETGQSSGSFGSSAIELSSYSCHVCHQQPQEPEQKKGGDEHDDEYEHGHNNYDNKLENVIKSFNQIIEKKDKQIQALYQKNQHQQEVILETHAKNEQLQRLIDALKELQVIHYQYQVRPISTDAREAYYEYQHEAQQESPDEPPRNARDTVNASYDSSLYSPYELSPDLAENVDINGNKTESGSSST